MSSNIYLILYYYMIDLNIIFNQDYVNNSINYINTNYIIIYYVTICILIIIFV